MHMTEPVKDNDNMKENDDIPSVYGRFVWTIVGNSCIPCLLKSDLTKFVSVRIAESKVLSHFLLRLNAEVFNCVSVKSFGITDAEMKLLNEINSKHCEFSYGRDAFSMDKDFIVKLDDLVEFYQFMDTCYNKLVNQTLPGTKNKCGFVRINDDSVVPYAVKDDQKYVPLFYFEGETDSLKTKAINLENWDLAYLKFCCKVQGIKNELFASEQCLVTSLEDVKSYFPEGTRFDDYWPSKVVEMQTSARSDINGNHAWVQTPHIDTTAIPQSTVPNTSHTIANKTQLGPAITKQVHNSQRVNTTSVMNNLSSSGFQGTWPSNVMSNSVPVNSAQAGTYHQVGVASVVGSQRLAPKQTPVTAHSINSNQSATSRGYVNQPAIRPQPQYFNPVSNISGVPISTQPPPPLVKVQTTISNVYTNSVPAVSYPPIYPASTSMYSMATTVPAHHLNNSSGSQVPNKILRTTPSIQQISSNCTRFPPALTPINGTSSIIQTNSLCMPSNTAANNVSSNAGSISHLGQRSSHSQSAEEIIDLLSPPHSPQHSNSNNINRIPSMTNASNYLIPKSNNSQGTTLSVPEAPMILGRHCFQIQKHPVREKTVNVINLEPNEMHSKLVFTLYEVHSHFFPKMEVSELMNALLKGLKRDLYKPNSLQKTLLKELYKHHLLKDPDDYTLILIDDFNKLYPQLAYLQNTQNNASRQNGGDAKRQKIS